MFRKLFLVPFILILAIVHVAPSQNTLKTYYVCPPCGCADDNKISLTSGDCPSCNMSLVEKCANEIPNLEQFQPLKPLDTPLNVAIFIYAQNQVLDFAGPYDVFVSGGRSFNVYTVGSTQAPVIMAPNLSVNPEYDIFNAPKPDILVIPAGLTNDVNESARQWIMKSADKAMYVLSVCNGAFLIAELGLLDGLNATCHLSGLKALEENFPKIKAVYKDVRYVDNGKIITSAGVSAGIDASYYVISKILGVAHALAAANSLEYLYWKPKSNKY